MNRYYAEVAARAGHRCEYCHAPEAIFNFPFEVEHIDPTSRLGSDESDNRALACRSCNLFKSDQLSGFDEVSQLEVRLFHPRRDRWEEHFAVDTDGATILGLTPIARVTIELLRLNADSQVHARKSWARLGLFP